MEDVFRTARTLVSHQLPGVSLIQECDPRLVIRGNANQLVHLVTNLLQNSLDSMRNLPPGVGEIRMAWKKKGGVAELSIRDNGPGIPIEIQPRIFDPFFTTKDVGQGTGLGLSTCYRISRQHLATIRVQSEPGVFCEFSIQFPLPDPATNLTSVNTKETSHAGTL